MSEWREVTLGRLADAAGGLIRTGPFGSQLHQYDYVDDGPALVVMPKDMAEGRISTESIARVSDETASRLSEHVLQAGDIVLARRGDIGRAAWVGERDGRVLCGTGSMRIHLPAGELSPRYLHYFLQTDGAADWLQGQAVGATMPNLNAEIVRALPIRYPSLKTQTAITDVLDTIDDLIENNRRRIALLERMARAVYQEWFVHFRYPGHEDDERVDSFFGPIPVNWCAVRTAQLIESSVLEIGDGYRAKNSEFSDEGVPFVRVRNVQNGTLQLAESDLLSFDYVARVAGKASRPGDCVIATKGTVGRVAFVGEATPTVIYSPQVSYWRLLDSSTLTPAYLRRWIQSDHFRLQCAQVKGATDMADYVNLKDQRRMWMLLPERRVQTEFATMVNPMHRLADSLSVSASVLSDLRDRLLPKLVTGAVDVSHLDLDALLEEPAA